MAFNANPDLHVAIRELKIHLAELEIQNEELKLAMKEMVAQQDKNEEIYDFGPLKEKPGKFNKDFHRVRARWDEVSKRANNVRDFIPEGQREEALAHVLKAQTG